jgi:hypothetical protein
MKKSKYTIIAGIVAGLIVIAPWIFSLIAGTGKSSIDLMEILGYTSIFLSLLVIFFGLRKTRNVFYSDLFTFRKAFYQGLTAVIIASTIYVIGWEMYYPAYKDQFMAEYQQSVVAQYQEQGLSEAEIELKKQELSAWMNYYQNPFIRMGLTFMEYFPISLLFMLLSAYILKTRKNDSSS